MSFELPSGRRLAAPYTVAAASLLLLASCSDNSDPPPATTPAATNQPAYTVHADFGDPRIVSATTAGGAVVEYYGAKDANGLASDLYATTVTDANGTIQFDLAGGLPTRVFMPDGIRFHLEWDRATGQAVLTAITADGETQVSTLIDFSQPLVALPIAQIEARSGLPAQLPTTLDWSPRGGRSATLERVPHVAPPDPFNIDGLEGVAGTSSAEVRTTVTSCGLPEDGVQVLTSLFDESNGQSIGTFPGVSAGNGQFTTSIPVGQQFLGSTQSNCQSIAGVIGIACTINDAFGPAASTNICVALSIALDAITIPSGEAAALVAACLSMAPAIELYCATAGASPVPGAPSVIDQLCDAVFDNAATPATLRVTTCVIALPSNVCAVDVLPSSGPFPISNSIDLGGSSTIRSLTLAPSAPAAGQDYVATADIFCLPAGSSVTLSIVGTDGYTDSITYPIQQTQDEGTFTLTVPGAAAGVMDTVTTTVSLAGGGTLTKTAFLVFG